MYLSTCIICVSVGGGGPGVYMCAEFRRAYTNTQNVHKMLVRIYSQRIDEFCTTFTDYQKCIVCSIEKHFITFKKKCVTPLFSVPLLFIICNDYMNLTLRCASPWIQWLIAVSAISLTAVFLSLRMGEGGWREERRKFEGEDREAYISHSTTRTSLKEWAIP